MVTFVSNTGNIQLQNAMQKAQELLKDGSPFLQTVADIKEFAMGNISGKELVPLFGQKLAVTVQVYRPINLFSRAFGYTMTGEDVVYLNRYKLRRSQASIVATLVHEVVHILDSHDTVHRFGHGDNHAEGKEETTPYKLDAIAEGIVEKEEKEEKEEALDEGKAQKTKHGSFVFCNGVGYEVPRSGLYQATKAYLTPVAK